MDICNQKFIDDNVTVIIRTVGERTEKLCRELLKKQISAQNIHMICETPFTEALKKTCTVAIEANRKWTFVVDADVLVRPGALQELLGHAEAAGGNAFEIEGKVLDKFLDSPRKAGNHLYRTALMYKALECIPGSLEALRPESFLKLKMCDQGYEVLVLEIIVGLHDFEQSYRDIYRKCFVQGKKHTNRVNTLIPLWKYLATRDADFIVAVRAFNDGKQYAGCVGIDHNSDFMAAVADVLRDLNMSEKKQTDDLEETAVLWSAADHLSSIMRRNNRDYKIKDQRLGIQQDQIRDLQNSNSFRLGWTLLTPFRLVKSWIKK